MPFSPHQCSFPHIFVNHTPCQVSHLIAFAFPNSSTILKYSSQAPKCIQETKGLSSSSSCLFAACMSPPSSMADLVLQYDNLDSHLTGSRSSRLMNHPVADACKNVLFAHVLDNFIVAFNEQSFAIVRTSLPFFFRTYLPKV
jgi:hypothetical protein